ncbi:MAG: hypothetical protein GXY67_05255 [Clostridiales bacterium]|nr:hypothetical protein [Clostridiales bacterium]
MVRKTVTATPLLNAPTPVLVMICTDKSVPSVTATLPVPMPVQPGSSEVFGPSTTADIPVVVGSSHPQGLVKMVAVTVSPSSIELSRILTTSPTMVAFTGKTTLLLVNWDAEEEVPSPSQPPLLMD